MEFVPPPPQVEDETLLGTTDLPASTELLAYYRTRITEFEAERNEFIARTSSIEVSSLLMLSILSQTTVHLGIPTNTREQKDQQGRRKTAARTGHTHNTNNRTVFLNTDNSPPTTNNNNNNNNNSYQRSYSSR